MRFVKVVLFAGNECGVFRFVVGFGFRHEVVGFRVHTFRTVRKVDKRGNVFINRVERIGYCAVFFFPEVEIYVFGSNRKFKRNGYFSALRVREQIVVIVEVSSSVLPAESDTAVAAVILSVPNEETIIVGELELDMRVVAGNGYVEFAGEYELVSERKSAINDIRYVLLCDRLRRSRDYILNRRVLRGGGGL